MEIKIDLKGKKLPKKLTINGVVYSQLDSYKYHPTSKDELKKIVDKEIEDHGLECDLNCIDVSKITDMSDLFRESKFNGDISKWDVSKVHNMGLMFYESKFTGDISNWNVSNVNSMSEIFEDSEFNEDISNWNVKNVKNMSGMFRNSKFNGDISKWDVSSVEDMSYMFAGSKFNRDISKWNVSKVIYMNGMFVNSEFEGDISNWNISNVMNMEDIFTSSNIIFDISKWKLGVDCKVRSMILGTLSNSRLGYLFEFNPDKNSFHKIPDLSIDIEIIKFAFSSFEKVTLCRSYDTLRYWDVPYSPRTEDDGYPELCEFEDFASLLHINKGDIILIVEDRRGMGTLYNIWVDSNHVYCVGPEDGPRCFRNKNLYESIQKMVNN